MRQIVHTASIYISTFRLFFFQSNFLKKALIRVEKTSTLTTMLGWARGVFVHGNISFFGGGFALFGTQIQSVLTPELIQKHGKKREWGKDVTTFVTVSTNHSTERFMSLGNMLESVASRSAFKKHLNEGLQYFLLIDFDAKSYHYYSGVMYKKNKVTSV